MAIPCFSLAHAFGLGLGVSMDTKANCSDIMCPLPNPHPQCLCGPVVCVMQIVLCENNIYSQGHMNDTLTHELVHIYDHCRAEVDWNNIHHLACSEIRAANLSGECFFWKETFGRFKFGWKKHHQVSSNTLGLDCTCCIIMSMQGLCEREGCPINPVCQKHFKRTSLSSSRSSF